MTHDLPRFDADNGKPVVVADQRNWGAGGRPDCHRHLRVAFCGKHGSSDMAG
jgi:hypothetical protein